MTMSFAVRLRAHGAGMEELAQRVLAGGRDPADLLALAEAPLPVLGALVAAVAPREAAVVGLLPVRLGADVEETVARALAHRAAPEAEVLELSARAPCVTGALDLACEALRRLLAQIPGATARVDEASLHALAAGAGLTPEGAAGRLAQAGVTLVTAKRVPGAAHLRVLPDDDSAETRTSPSGGRAAGEPTAGGAIESGADVSAETRASPSGGRAAGGPTAEGADASGADVSAETPAAPLGEHAQRIGALPIRESWEVPPAIDARFVAALLAGPRRPLFLRASRETTGIVLLRAVALARLAGHGPIAVGGEAELKGPDACLSFGADTLEAELEPAGSLGSRNRAYGEAAIRGAQLALVPPRRRMAPGRRAAHILDEDVDPALLPGGAGEEIH